MSGSKGKLYAFILIVAIPLGLLASYEISVISGVILFLEKSFSLTTAMKSQIASIIILGAWAGIICAGPFVDYFGRKKGLLLSATFYFSGAMLTLFTGSINQLLVARILSGVGIGIASVTVPLYLTEASPPNIRGRVVASFQLAITLGILLSYVVNLCTASIGCWRISFIAGLILSVIGFIGASIMPESPGWSKIKGRSKKGAFTDLLRGKLLWPFLLMSFLTCFQQSTGINTVIYYIPTVLIMMGIENISTSLLITVGVGVVNVIATIFALFWVDTFGRRKLLITGLIGMFCSLGVFVALLSYPIIAIASLFIYVIFFAISLGPVVQIFISEIFPTALRGKAVAFGFFSIWFFNYCVTVSFLGLVQLMTIRGVYAMYAVICLFALIFVYRCIPETKGKTLEEIQQLWYK